MLGTNDNTYFVPAFSLDQYEVSRGQFGLCVEAGICSAQGSLEGNDNLPVTSISAYEAATFCKWLGRRLPTVTEWERAVRGTDGRAYPWGDERMKPDTERVNALTLQDLTYVPDGLMPVDSLPEGATREGRIYHLFGNAIEWTSSPSSCRNVYACDTQWDGESDIGAVYTVDSGWQNVVENITFGQPIEMDADFPLDDVGFRCASDGQP
jgi:formylglycine-generating enzyme required for sulfatase activity